MIPLITKPLTDRKGYKHTPSALDIGYTVQMKVLVKLTDLHFGDKFLFPDAVESKDFQDIYIIANAERYFYLTFKREIDLDEPIVQRNRIFYIATSNGKLYGKLAKEAAQMEVHRVIKNV